MMAVATMGRRGPTFLRGVIDRLRRQKVDKVVALSVLGAVLLAWGVVVALDALLAFVNEINDVGTGDYTLSKAITYILLTLPRRAYEYFAATAAA